MHALTSAFVSEFRILCRQFQKAPLTFLSSIAVLALGIGGTTAVFSALYAVALRSLPYPKAQELVVVHSQFPRLQMNRMGISPLDYFDLRKVKHLFSDAGAFFYLDLSRTGIDHAEKINAVATTTSMFETLRVRPNFGRYFSVNEERIGGRHVVILSDRYWRGAFGTDAGVLNKAIQLNGESYSVIGVMPQSFVFPDGAT